MSSLFSFSLRGDNDLTSARNLLKRLSQPTVVDFEERMTIPSIRATLRLWQAEDNVIAFAYVDAFNNLWFEISPEHQSRQLENEIIDWGVTCLRERNANAGEPHTLDASFDAGNLARIELLERHGFVREKVRTLKFERSLVEPIPETPFPPGFSMRSANGEQEVERLVALHRAAFGTENMTVEERLAIIHAPNYVPELDLLAVAPNGDLAAFCICGLEQDEPNIGYTDPIGTHPRYQRLGVARALVTTGLCSLRTRGARMARLGTSSENLPMRRLAENLGFMRASEILWFSKQVS